MLVRHRSLPNQYIFHTEAGEPLPQATYNRMWLKLMLAAGCTVEREPPDGDGEGKGAKKGKPAKWKPNDIRQRFKATITPHYLRHNYVTLLYEAGIDPLIAMRLVGHTDYQTTASIYTHLKDDALKKAATNIEDVFGQRAAAKPIQKAVNSNPQWGMFGR